MSYKVQNSHHQRTDTLTIQRWTLSDFLFLKQSFSFSCWLYCLGERILKQLEHLHLKSWYIQISKRHPFSLPLSRTLLESFQLYWMKFWEINSNPYTKTVMVYLFVLLRYYVLSVCVCWQITLQNSTICHSCKLSLDDCWPAVLANCSQSSLWIIHSSLYYCGWLFLVTAVVEM